jgi:hypothetical protein
MLRYVSFHAKKGTLFAMRVISKIYAPANTFAKMLIRIGSVTRTHDAAKNGGLRDIGAIGLSGIRPVFAEYASQLYASPGRS